MQTIWLLGGLGLGAGLMYLMDPEKGAARRDAVREHVADYRYQTGALLDDTRRTLTAERGLPLGLCLLGCVGLGAGVVSLLAPQGGPQRRAWLREQVRGYWHTAAANHAPQRELRRAWRFFQGQDTPRVDAHTRKPARAQAWYAEPADYESDVLYSEPFATRAEAEAWAHTDEQRRLQDHTEV
jgi:hypothetical protein